MEADRLADQLLNFVLRAADHADAGEVGAVSAPRLAFVLDYDQVFAAVTCLAQRFKRRA